MSAIFAF